MAGLEGRNLGRYELRQLLGRGGMADVYLGYDPHFEREVAVKVFKREDEDMLRRFIREAQLMASLRHPHLITVYDTGVADSTGGKRYYIVMPYMSGGTLRGRIRRSPLSLQEAADYLGDIASALDYVHQNGIIHRDIKSSNVLLDRNARCYLADFGIARNVSDATQMTSTGNVLGTVDYVAPELFEPEHKADRRSDFYSLGVLLYEMVTGRLPFVGENQLAIVSMHVNKRPPSPRTFVADLPPLVEQVMLRELEKDPARRFGSARELAEAFYQAVSAPPAYQRGVVSMPDTSSPVWGEHEAQTVAEQFIPAPAYAPPPRGATMRANPLDEGTIGYRQPEPQLAYRETPRPPKKRVTQAQRRRRIVAVLAGLTLAAVIVPAIIFGATKYKPTTGTVTTVPGQTTQGAPTQASTTIPTATPNLTATASVSGNATAQAAAQSTGTAIAQATSTVKAQASATAGAVQTATANTPSFANPLTDENSVETQDQQWRSDSGCAFRDDGYHVIGGVADLKGCRETGKPFSNGTISVDMIIASGGAGGIFIRVDADLFNRYSGYLFDVDAAGNYHLSVSNNYNSASTKLKTGKVPSGWKQGYGVKNALQVVARDASIALYANGVYLTTIQDATYKSGTVGFVTMSGTDGAGGEAVYSNLKVFP